MDKQIKNLLDKIEGAVGDSKQETGFQSVPTDQGEKQEKSEPIDSIKENLAKDRWFDKFRNEIIALAREGYDDLEKRNERVAAIRELFSRHPFELEIKGEAIEGAVLDNEDFDALIHALVGKYLDLMHKFAPDSKTLIGEHEQFSEIENLAYERNAVKAREAVSTILGRAEEGHSENQQAREEAKRQKIKNKVTKNADLAEELLRKSELEAGNLNLNRERFISSMNVKKPQGVFGRLFRRLKGEGPREVWDKARAKEDYYRALGLWFRELQREIEKIPDKDIESLIPWATDDAFRDYGDHALEGKKLRKFIMDEAAQKAFDGEMKKLGEAFSGEKQFPAEVRAKLVEDISKIKEEVLGSSAEIISSGP